MGVRRAGDPKRCAPNYLAHSFPHGGADTIELGSCARHNSHRKHDHRVVITDRNRNNSIAMRLTCIVVWNCLRTHTRKRDRDGARTLAIAPCFGNG